MLLQKMVKLDFAVSMENKGCAPDIRERLAGTGLTFTGKLLRRRVGDNRRDGESNH